MSGQPEVPHTEDEEAGKAFLISSWTKQVLNSPNTSMLIAGLIKTYAQKKKEHVECHLVSYNDSENHAEETSNLVRHEFSNIEDRV